MSTELTESRRPRRVGRVGELSLEAASAEGAVEKRMPIWTVAVLSSLLPRRWLGFHGLRGAGKAWSSLVVGLVPRKGLVKVGASALTDAFDIKPGV